MKITVCETKEQIGILCADIAENVIKSNPHARLGFATGESPLEYYGELVRRSKSGQIDFSGIDTVNLDEYYGLEPSHDQSYRYFMNKNLFDGINVKKENTFVPMGNKDSETACAEYDKILAEKRISLQVLGSGRNGHIGFNEPSDALTEKTHIENLTKSTIDANKRFFDSIDDVPTKAITMGIGPIMQAEKLILIMNTVDKADAAKALIFGGKITPQCPITFVLGHPDTEVFITKELADAIGYKD